MSSAAHFTMAGSRLQEVAAALAGSGFTAVTSISSGAFGHVVLGKNPAGEDVAIKCMRPR